MSRQTVYVLILAAALFAGSYMGQRVPTAGAEDYSAMSTSSRLRTLETKVAALDRRVKALEKRVTPKGVDPLDVRVGNIEDALKPSDGSGPIDDPAIAGLQLQLDKWFGDEDSQGVVQKEFVSVKDRLTAVETTAPLKTAAKLAPLTDSAETLGKLGKYVEVSTDPTMGVAGPNIFFKGANIHIVDGSGKTWTGHPPRAGSDLPDWAKDYDRPNGLGNLIIGYNEYWSRRPEDVRRTGSHTLVVGPGNDWTGWSGVVFGVANSAYQPISTITGGAWNTTGRGTNSYLCSILGGNPGTATGSQFVYVNTGSWRLTP